MPGSGIRFLDVITNIVGILILLVLVVGLRTQRSVHNGPDPQIAEEARVQDQLKKVTNAALSTELKCSATGQKVGNAHNEVNFREGERAWLEHGDCRGGAGNRGATGHILSTEGQRRLRYAPETQ